MSGITLSRRKRRKRNVNFVENSSRTTVEHQTYVITLQIFIQLNSLRAAQVCLSLKKDMFKTKCSSNARSKEITDKIVNMIVMDTCPIRMVECEGFRKLIHCLEPGFVMPSRQSIKLIVFRKHQEGKSKLTNTGKLTLLDSTDGSRIS